MRRAALALFLFTAALPGIGSAVEPRIFLVGVWPNRVRFFDEAREEFVGEMRLRYGAITNVFGSDRTSDYRRFFFVTDRMEAVEVVDLPSRSIVDEIKLSSPERRVRIYAAVPDPSEQVLYITVEAVGMEVDRFVPEDVDVVRYSLAKHEVLDSFRLPAEIEAPFLPPPIRPSPDGSFLYVLSQNIYVLDAETREIVDRIELSKPRAPGYGPVGLGFGGAEAAPGVLVGFYRSPDPILKKTMFGIARVDLNRRSVESFELSSDVNVEWFGLSPDGKRGYAGMGDLVAVDLENRKLLALKKGVERGRQNTTIVVSADGKKLYVAGVGPDIDVYDAETLEPIRKISAGGDVMNPPQPVPRSVLGY